MLKIFLGAPNKQELSVGQQRSTILKSLDNVKFSKSIKGHNSVKMLDTVTSSSLKIGVMMVNKCAKFQSHMSMDFENI
jgi:hypothetical protein